MHPVCCMIPRPRAWDSVWLQLPTHDYFAHGGTKDISIPQALPMTSRSILASAPAIVELPSPSPGELHGTLHELIRHPLGRKAPMQGDQMDSIVPVLPTGVHHKGLRGRNRHPPHSWAWVLLSLCHKSWAKVSLSTIWRAGCSLEVIFYPLQLTAHHGQLFTSSSTSLLMSPETACHPSLTQHYLRYPYAGANALFRRVVYRTFGEQPPSPIWGLQIDGFPATPAVGGANTHHQQGSRSGPRLDNKHMRQPHKENATQVSPKSLQPGSDVPACGTKQKLPIFPVPSPEVKSEAPPPHPAAQAESLWPLSTAHPHAGKATRAHWHRRLDESIAQAL